MVEILNIIKDEIMFLFFSFLTFLNTNSGAIQGIAIIFLVAITGYYAFLIRQSNRIQSLRPHSEKLLEKEISPWLKDTITKTFILDPLRLPDDEKWIENFDFEKLPLLFDEHLKTGYKEIYLEYKGWEKRVEQYNEELKKFIRELRNEAKSKIGLPSDSDFPNRGKIYCYYQRMISDLLPSLIANGELSYLKKELKIEVYDEKRYSVKLSAGELVEGIFVSAPESAKIVEIKKFIKEVLTSPEIIKKARGFYETYKNLVKNFENLKNEIVIKIEDELKAGGLIKGKCRACL